jgi:molybdopterin biosynthesis enzyme
MKPTKKKIEGRTLRIGMRRVDGIAARVAVIESGDEIIKVENENGSGKAPRSPGR